MTQTYTAQQLAALFQWSTDYMYKKLSELEGGGFPQRIPGTNRWSRPMVDRWFAGESKAQIEPPKPDFERAARQADILSSLNGQGVTL